MTEALWYFARGTGVVSLVLLTVVMVLGVGARAGRPVFGLPSFAASLVHRNASLMATILIAVHVTALLFDPYAQLRLVDVIMPFGAAYRPMWVGLGTTAGDVMIALIATGLLRRRIGVRAWRAVHWLAYAAWPVAWLHGIGSGTDRGSAWYLVTAVVCALTVGAALVWRLRPSFANAGRQRMRRRIPDALRTRPAESTGGA
jgi:sulfoxide reductase heme-binding subunit YedZ